MSIMDNEGHDPQGLGNTRPRHESIGKRIVDMVIHAHPETSCVHLYRRANEMVSAEIAALEQALQDARLALDGLDRR